MLMVEDKPCFSPAVPHFYSQPTYDYFRWCKQDMARWNLAWLSFPQLGKERVEPGHFGMVAAMAGPELVQNIVGLRGALETSPIAFLKVSAHIEWERLPPYQVFGEKWVTTMNQRAMASEPKRKLIEKQIANVVYGKFGK